MFKTLGIASLGLLFLAGTAIATEHEGEDTLYGEKCAECHFEDDFSGETAEAIAALIDEIKAGNTKHKYDMADLSDEDLKKIIEFFASQ